mmetsp:Transcript_64270/g.141598  ORF Transcript_64270/g.141598 Transcript_64270/m.141598 type:complete len:297 (-) Transcript_64270:45-935(-)
MSMASPAYVAHAQCASSLVPAYVQTPSPAGPLPRAEVVPPPGLELPTGVALKMAAMLQPEEPKTLSMKCDLRPKAGLLQSETTDFNWDYPRFLQKSCSMRSMSEDWVVPGAYFDGRPRGYTWPSAADWLGGVPEQAPVAQRRRHRQCERRRRCQLQIATHLNDLEQEDPACVFFVRQISKLGFKSPEILKEHFEQYGAVSKVLVSNSHDKSSDAPFPVRLRPSGMGFVLMERAEDAAKALAQGEVHVVHGVQIVTRAFEQRSTQSMMSDKGDDEESLPIEEAETTASSASSPRDDV